MMSKRLIPVALWLLSSLLTPAARGEVIVVRGQVVDDAGKPLEGATVHLRPLEGSYERSVQAWSGERSTESLASDQTDRLGNYEIRALAGLYSIDVDATGFVPMERRLEPLLEDSVLNRLQLVRSLECRVQVFDSTGQVISGARIVTLVRSTGPWRHRGQGPEAWRPASRQGLTDVEGKLVLPCAFSESLGLRVSAAGKEHFRGAIGGWHPAIRVTLKTAQPRSLVVYDAAGDPVAGAILELDHILLGRTDGNGRIQFVDVPWDNHLLLTRDGSSKQAPELPASGEVLRLPPEHSLEGRVVRRDDGKPLAGALVWSPRGLRNTRTDAEGRFRWTWTGGAKVDLMVAHPGYRDWTMLAKPESLAELGADGLHVALETLFRIRGRVVDTAGRGLSGVAIDLRYHQSQGPWWSPKVSESDGSFMLSRLEGGRTFEVRAQQPGVSPVVVVASASPATAGEPWVELVLGLDAPALQGRFVDENGKPIEGALVEVFLQAVGQEAPLESTGSDSEGRFVLRRIPEGRHLLVISKEGMATEGRFDIQVNAESETDLGEIVMQRGALLDLRLVDIAGRPVAAAEVELSLERSVGDADLLRRRLAQSRSSSPTGEVRFERLTRGVRYWVLAESEDYLPAGRWVVPTAEPLELVLKPGSTISGRVVDPLGNGLPDINVASNSFQKIDFLTKGVRRSTRTGPEGSFVLKGVPHGKVDLIAQRRGFVKQRHVLELAAGERRQGLRLELQQGLTVSGRIVDVEGNIVARASIGVSSPEGAETPFSIGSLSGSLGEFTVDSLPAGRAIFTARAQALGEVRQEIVVEQGMKPLEIVLSSEIFVQGRVVDSQGQGVVGATVMFERGRMGTRTLSGVDGSFRHVVSEPGRIRLLAERADMGRAVMEIQTSGQSVSDLRLVIPDTVAIVGTVLGVTPHQASRVSITAHRLETNDADRSYRRLGHIGPGEQYRIPGITAGTWSIEARLVGSDRRTRTVIDVPVGEQDALVDLDLTE